MRKLYKILSVILVLVLLFPSSAFASATSVEAEDAAATRVGEVVELRETNSETYLMSDGTYECVIFAEDKYYRDSNDALQLIDNSLVAASSATGLMAATQYRNAANAFDITLSGSGTPEVSIDYNGAGIRFSSLGAAKQGTMHMTASDCVVAIGAVENCAALDQLTATGSNTATYPNIFTATDLVYVLDNDALKEYIILKNSSAPNEFGFLFELDGLTMQTVDGFTHFVNENEETVFTLGSLFAVDANGKPTDALTYEFVPVKGNADQVIVTVTLDDDYLTAADRAFPVVIDPTVMISSSQTADTCVCEGFPSTNYYAAAQLRTGYDTDYGRRRSFIKFNIPSSIPADSVTAARLDVEKVSGATPSIRARRVTSTWTSSTLTWESHPSSSIVNQSPIATLYSSGSSWYTMDVTGIVQVWVNGDAANYGFLLLDMEESDPNHWTTWYSSDADSPHKPELYITYSCPSVNLNIIFDHAYVNRYSSASTRIMNQAEALKTKYQNTFGITINYSTPVVFSSYADAYCTTSPTTQCSHGTCENSYLYATGIPELKSYHHTNIRNIMLRIPFPNLSTGLKMAYIGHNTCFASESGHITNPYLGLTYPLIGLATVTNFGSVASETKTMVHEFGHLYDAPDHSGFPTTAEIRQETGDSRFSEVCIYGEQKDTSSVMNNLTICDGCAAIIASNRNRYNHS